MENSLNKRISYHHSVQNILNSHLLSMYVKMKLQI